MEDKQQIEQLLYRSRASSSMAMDELRDLLQQARERNAAEELTGLLVHDRDRFVQWLEGPRDNLEKVWSSIQNDSRHYDVERIYVPRLRERVFANWDMQLGLDGNSGVQDEAEQEQFEQVTLPAKAIKDLREHRIDVHEIVSSVAFWHAIPNIDELTELLATGNEKAVQQLFDQILELNPSIYSLAWHLFGPVASALGDAWMEDQLNSAQLTLAQSRLCQLLRSVSRSKLDENMPRRDGLVLVSPMPGENALVGASFACIAFETIGWSVQWAFVQKREELLEMVKNNEYTIVHLELSDTFMHKQTLPDLSRFIQQIRQESANPSVKVLVGGRVFSEQYGLSVVIGADGDAVSRGSEAKDIEAMLEFKGWNQPMDPMMIAQAALLEVCQKIQKRYFEEP